MDDTTCDRVTRAVERLAFRRTTLRTLIRVGATVQGALGIRAQEAEEMQGAKHQMWQERLLKGGNADLCQWM